MKSFSVRIYMILLAVLLLSGCGYTKLASLDRDVQVSWNQVEQVLDERTQLAGQFIKKSQGGDISPIAEELLKDGYEQLKGFIVLPGKAGSQKAYLELQKNQARAFSLIFQIEPDLSAEWLEVFSRNNADVLSAWNHWTEKKKVFNLYIQPFPRSLVAPWLGFTGYDEENMGIEDLWVEIPEDKQE